MNSVNLSSFFVFVVLCHFQLNEAIRSSAAGDELARTTRKPDYSDVYEKIDDNDIFKNMRRIMRMGDPANGVPKMAPFKRDHQYDSNMENELGNVEHQRVEGLDQFVTKSSLIYSNNEKFDFSLLWPKVTFLSRHSSTNNYRVFYSNYTFVGCTLKGEADVQRTNVNENCYKLKELRLTLHFKNYDVNVVTTSNNENDKEIARTAKQTLDRYIKQEYTLGLEKPAYELEQKIKEYFGSYRCLLQEDVPNQRPSRTNENRDDRAFIDFDSNARPSTSGIETFNTNIYSTHNQRDVGRNFGSDSYDDRRSQSNVNQQNPSYDDLRPQTSTQNTNQRPNSHQNPSYDDRRPSSGNNNRNTLQPDPEPIYFPAADARNPPQPSTTYNNNNRQNAQNSQNSQVYNENRQTQSTQTSYYPQSNREVTTTSRVTTTTRRPISQSTSRRTQETQQYDVAQNNNNRAIQQSANTNSAQFQSNPVYRQQTTQNRATTYYDYS